MYKSKLNITETQYAIAKLKEAFSFELGKALNLIRVSAPLFVNQKSGLNDGLNGEKPVSFIPKNLNQNLEIVHSLAKWKRYALKKYGFKLHHGLYCDMNAIRKEEELDFSHSLYVDQWDWELIISENERTISFLKTIVNKIYKALLKTNKTIKKQYNNLSVELPKNIHFITSQELLNLYPNLMPEQREYEIVKRYQAVFIIGIGNKLSDNKPHSLRAKDYDDWNLNGDLIVYHKINDCALELSSMGIRVNKKALLNQYQLSESEIENISPYHKQVVSKELPFTIGGGIGQSRLAMFLLEKKHIGEVQVSAWDSNIDNSIEIL